MIFTARRPYIFDKMGASHVVDNNDVADKNVTIDRNVNEALRLGGTIMPPNLLQEQIRLPKDKWSEQFKQLIAQKIEENQRGQDEDVEKSPTVLREETFRRYMDGLGLSEEMVRSKTILDLGSGDGEFVQELIEKGITPAAYGIDAHIDTNSFPDELRGHFFQGNFEEDLPIQNADYVVSVGAISNAIWGGKEVMNVRRIIENALAALRDGGEIRIYPIQEAALANPLEGLRASKEKWQELIADISTTHGVECTVAPRGIKVTGNNNDVILESVLIIRKADKMDGENPKIAH